MSNEEQRDAEYNESRDGCSAIFMERLAELEAIVGASELFAGATRVLLAPDVYDRLVDGTLERSAREDPLFSGIAIARHKYMQQGCGMGFRPKRDGDDPALVFGEETLVWSLAPENRK